MQRKADPIQIRRQSLLLTIRDWGEFLRQEGYGFIHPPGPRCSWRSLLPFQCKWMRSVLAAACVNTHWDRLAIQFLQKPFLEAV